MRPVRAWIGADTTRWLVGHRLICQTRQADSYGLYLTPAPIERLTADALVRVPVVLGYLPATQCVGITCTAATRSTNNTNETIICLLL